MRMESAIALCSLWIIKPLLILTVIALGALVLRRRSAALQHFWLASGIAAMFFLLVLSPFLPTIEWQILPADVDQQSPLVAVAGDLLGRLGRNEYLLIFASYFFVASSLISYFLVGVWQLHQQSKHASIFVDADAQEILQELCTLFDIARPVQLLVSPEVKSPQMWGIWRPKITLPVAALNWSSERKLSVLLHELAHVARFDWATTVLVKIVCALFWFLPPVWWLATRLSQYAEMACDDFIYRLRDKRVVYAENLLALAHPTIKSDAAVALGMAGHSAIFDRIQAILDLQRSHASVAPEARQYWLLVLTMLLLPLAGLQLMPIRETLLVRLLIIENPSPKSTAAIAADEEKNQIRLLDSQTLQELKQRLTVTQLPDRRAQEIDHMIVIGQPALLADEDDEIGVLNAILPRPDIRIEGYMPIRTVVPIYPRHALAQGIEGEVTVRFTIAANGAVVEPEVIAATPRRVFDRAVLTALREWHYQPQMIDGNPVILQGVSEKFTFQLDPPVSSPRRR